MATQRLSPALRQFADNVESGARENAFESVREEHRDWKGYLDEHPQFGYYVVSTAEDILWGGHALVKDYGAPGIPRDSTKKKILDAIRAKYQPRRT